MPHDQEETIHNGDRRTQGLVFALVAVLGYWLAARAGLMFIPAGGGITPVWPPNGVGIGLCLVTPVRRWPWIFLGVGLACVGANLAAERPLLVTSALTAGNLLEVIAGAGLFRFFHRGRVALTTRRESALMAIMVLPCFALTSLLGAEFSHLLLGGDFVAEWLKWWLGDAVGTLLVAPPIILAARVRREGMRVRGKRFVEGCFWLSLHVAVCAFVFVVAPKIESPSVLGATVYPYLTLLTLLFVAVRYGVIGSALAGAVTALFALTAHVPILPGMLPVGDVSTVLSMQLFLAVSGLLGLYVGTQREERLLGALALRESEERFRLLTEFAPNGVFLTNAAGTLTYVNAAAQEIAGRRQAQLLGARGLQSVHPEDREGMLAAWLEAVAAGSDFARDYRFVRPDGEVRWTVGRAAPLRDHQGRLTGYVGNLTDITPLKLAEQRLRESEQRFRRMADSMPAMVWTADSQGARDYFNKAWLKFRGRTAEEESGDGWRSGIHVEDLDRFIDTHDAAIGARMSYTIEYRLLRHDGIYRYVLGTGAPRYTGEGIYLGMIGTCLDVTPLREAEANRLALQAQMQESARLESIARLAAGVAHEFNNQLTSVLANANLAQLEPGLSTAARDHLSRIEESAFKAADLTRKMLSFSGRTPSIRSLQSVSSIVEETLPLLRASLPKQVPLTVQLGRDLPSVVADASQVQQVLANLFSNAVEALDAGEGSIAVSTSSRQCDQETLREMGAEGEVPEGQYVALRVTDDGCGIATEHLVRIFDPFFSTKFLGRGLGLSAAQGIVRAHGGWLQVESVPGNGATFTAYFPAAARPALFSAGTAKAAEFQI